MFFGMYLYGNRSRSFISSTNLLSSFPCPGRIHILIIQGSHYHDYRHCKYLIRHLLLARSRVGFQTTSRAVTCAFRVFHNCFPGPTHFKTHRTLAIHLMGNIWTKQTRLTTSNGSTPVDDLDVIMTSHSTDEDQDDFLMDTNNDSWDYDEPYELLPDGSRRKAGQNREKKCNTCGDWIDLGNVDTGEMALTNHQGRRRCLQKAKAKDLRLDQSATAAALNDIRCSGNILPRTPHNSNQFCSSPYTPISAMSFLSGTSPPT
jgi:hypothetical protein